MYEFHGIIFENCNYKLFSWEWCSEFVLFNISFGDSNLETFEFNRWETSNRKVLFMWNFRLVSCSQRFWSILLILNTIFQNLSDGQKSWYIMYGNGCTTFQKKSEYQSRRLLWISFVFRIKKQVLKPTRWSSRIFHIFHFSGRQIDSKFVPRFEKLSV